MTAGYRRDLKGYGSTPPKYSWPNNARVAVQFVVNFEEGGENALLHGDAQSERFLSEIVGTEAFDDRHLSMESIYEYGSRAGFWRLHRLFQKAQIPVTVFGVTTALARNPDAVAAMKQAGWEIACHGLRWIHYQDFSEQQERAHIEQAIAMHQQITGSKPAGWYTGRTSPHTLKIISERDDILYCADSYADDLPYWDCTYGKPLCIVPYTLDSNDMRFATPQGFNTGEQFFQYLKDAFDVLYEEGESSPKMLSIGLHCRLAGRPGRLAGLKRFIEYINKFDGVWCTTREAIAESWLAQTDKPQPSDFVDPVQSTNESAVYTESLLSSNATESQGPLAGTRLSIKDLFDINGHTTGAGSPAWRAAAQPAQATATAVTQLTDAGAFMVAKTQLDELAYSLNGENHHYGPVNNPVAPGRRCGGSSSGAAWSVASGDADLALATDTGGSIRVPASYCGLYGMRPTQGSISTKGLVPLAPRFDTVGLLAKSPYLLQSGYEALQPQMKSEPIHTLAWCEAVWQDVEPALKEKAYQLYLASPLDKVHLESPVLDAEARATCFTRLQAVSIWQTHGSWLKENIDSFGSDIRQRLEAGKALTPEQIAEAESLMDSWQSHLSSWLSKGVVLLMPTVPAVAPHLSDNAKQVAAQRQALLGLTAIAGLSGYPQLQMPFISHKGAPLGISLLGTSNSDWSLTELAIRLYPLAQQINNR